MNETPSTSERRIDEFWGWFKNHSDQIVRSLKFDDGVAATESMQTQLKALCTTIGWEIGPVSVGRQFLAFTLNGDLRNLETIEQILKKAPSLRDWDFIAGRPRREFRDIIILRNELGQERSFSLKDWRYVLTSFDNNAFFDIEIATDVRLRLDEKGQQKLLTTAVQGALGEFDTLKFIDRISFAANIDDTWESRASPFIHLSAHIDSLVRR
jgi:hypothetical protein